MNTISEQPEKLALSDGVVSFQLFQEFKGKYVMMNDRFETVHIWNEELAIRNKGRWTPKEITKERYDEEKKHSWNN